jgi:hypothetical protein
MTLAASALDAPRRSLLLMASALGVASLLRVPAHAGIDDPASNASSNYLSKGRHPVTSDTMTQAKLTTIASFPPQNFLENLAIRGDNSILVTVLNHKELWYIPPSANGPVAPLLLFTFAQPALGIVEIEPDIFLHLHFERILVARVISLPPGLARLGSRNVGQSGGCPRVSRSSPRAQWQLHDRSEHHARRRLDCGLDLAHRLAFGRGQDHSPCMAQARQHGL